MLHGEPDNASNATPSASCRVTKVTVRHFHSRATTTRRFPAYCPRGSSCRSTWRRGRCPSLLPRCGRPAARIDADVRLHPECHWLPCFDWVISGSRLPAAYLVRRGRDQRRGRVNSGGGGSGLGLDEL